MNKSEFIAAVAEKSELTKKDSEKAVAAMMDAIMEAVAQDDKVQLIGFGTFERRERGEKVYRNPRTGEQMTVAPCKYPVFKAGRAFKEAVDK